MASSSHQTHYEILGITQKAQLKEVRDAYRKLALKSHPDKDPHNPQAVAAFQKLGAAYETLSDASRRTIYDATLSSSQRARQPPQPAHWPPQRPSQPGATTRPWQEDSRSRAWDWSRRARERADQARREDADFWSGPTYAHGATDRNGWGNEWDPEQKDRYNQRPDPDWSDKVQKEYQKRVEKEKRERADRRKAEREQSEKTWPAELLLLLSKIISMEVSIVKLEAKVDESKTATQNEKEDEDHEHIFHLLIERKSQKGRLKECLNEYKRIVKLLRDQGREEEACEAEIKLREAREEVERAKKAGRNGSSQGEQAESTKMTKAKRKADKDRGKPLANNEGSYPDQKSTTIQPSELSEPSGGKGSNAEQPPKTTLPMYDGQNDEDTIRQQQPFREHMASPRVRHDYSDPDRGFTEDTFEPSIAGDDNDYDDKDYDPPFCNDFHDSHMEVHREFWDIIDSWHECNFCHRECTVMRCPKCDIQACGYCKDKFV